MKDIRVHIKVERYIKEWLICHFGNPVRFPDRSFENEVLHRMLTRRPPNEPPELPSDDTVSIVITDNKHHRPEFYNYLGFHGQRTVVSAIDGLFRISLWSGCFPLIHSKGELNKGIDLWCEQNGISLDAREAVRQKFYRLRKTSHKQKMGMLTELTTKRNILSLHKTYYIDKMQNMTVYVNSSILYWNRYYTYIE